MEMEMEMEIKNDVHGVMITMMNSVSQFQWEN